ncbi:hypothetical protein [Falsiroseomonas sp.]|uniref:hypothetical protein n=1 Tax=Falsiroseomonas sp. TaxID=2870721 RepID=UPI003F72A2B5
MLFILALLAGGAVLLYWHWAQRSAVAFFNAYAVNDRAALALMVDWPSVRAVAEATAPDAAANLFRDPLAGAIAGAATGLAGRRVIQSLAGPDLLALLLPSGPVGLLQGSLDGPGRLVAPMVASDGRRWHLVFELRGLHWLLIGVRPPSRPR